MNYKEKHKNKNKNSQNKSLINYFSTYILKELTVLRLLLKKLICSSLAINIV